MNTSYVFLADGFEEIEALSVVDIMRRAEMKVVTVSITDRKLVCGAHGVPVETDTTFADVDFSAAEWLILPGGMPGATNLAAKTELCDLLKAQNAKGGNIAAICASPAVVLAPLGILDGKTATCYPGFEKALSSSKLCEKPVAVDGNVITANGPAAAMAFGLAIVTKSKGEDASRNVAEGMLLYSTPQPFFF
ncbi:MAG: DJ-1/PfpI family protein [Bacteroidales bacterium]|nr:DJ-1/PfpI family protein [Bacteroidales bacterium]